MNNYRDKIILGNVIEKLKDMPGNYVQTIVTSPPYYGLRNYGTKFIIFGGIDDCDHEWETISGWKNRGTEDLRDSKQSTQSASRVTVPETSTCIKCNAWIGELGLEPTPEMYVEHIVEVFKEARRVLREDGTLWLNLGDSYYGSGQSSGHTPETKNLSSKVFMAGASPNGSVLRGRTHSYLKPKDLCMIPALVAIALQKDGWYLRSDIIWHKNGMPESVYDRPTNTSEHIFLFSKNRKYYYDYTAILEPYTSALDRWGGCFVRNECETKTDQFAVHERAGRDMRPNPHGKNKRNIWKINTQGLKEAHFAVFPEKLVEPCILAGSSEKGACAECGSPYKRILGNSKKIKDGGYGSKTADHNNLSPTSSIRTKEWTEYETIGWEKSCTCDTKEKKPCIILDTFFGSGTTGIVAKRADRNYVGIEIKKEYKEIAEKRLTKYHVQYKLDLN